MAGTRASTPAAQAAEPAVLGASTQLISGTIKIAGDHVRLQVTLPWLLAKLAGKAQALIQREGRLMLEEKK